MTFQVLILLVFCYVFLHIGSYAEVNANGEENLWYHEGRVIVGNLDGISGFLNKRNKRSTAETISKIDSTTEEFEIVSKQKVAVLSSNVDGYTAVGEPHTIDGASFKFITQKYKKLPADECVKLVTVVRLPPPPSEDMLDTVKISCEYEDPDKLRGINMRFEGVIFEIPPFGMVYVVKDSACLLRQYMFGNTNERTLSEKECDDLSGRTKDERQSGVIPGTEPMNPEDLRVMENQIVAVTKGSVKGFKPTGDQYTYESFSKRFTTTTQDYQKDGQCVKLVSFRRNDHDQDFDQIKIPCGVTGPAVNNDEDIEFNFGNILYILDKESAVFIIKDGVCLLRNYFVFLSKVVVTSEETLSLPDCYTLTRWRLEDRKSPVKMNIEPPPKTIEVPGLMWLLSMDDDTTGYEPGPVENNYVSDGMEFSTQDFYKGDEECVRIVYITLHGVPADRVKVSCGDIVNLHIAGEHLQFGKVFIIQPENQDTFKALFNVREESCILRIYTLTSNEIGISKSPDNRVENQECKDLAAGKDLLNNIVSPDGRSKIKRRKLISTGGNVRIVSRPVPESSSALG